MSVRTLIPLCCALIASVSLFVIVAPANAQIPRETETAATETPPENPPAVEPAPREEPTERPPVAETDEPPADEPRPAGPSDESATPSPADPSLEPESPEPRSPEEAASTEVLGDELRPATSPAAPGLPDLPLMDASDAPESATGELPTAFPAIPDFEVRLDLVDPAPHLDDELLDAHHAELTHETPNVAAPEPMEQASEETDSTLDALRALISGEVERERSEVREMTSELDVGDEPSTVVNVTPSGTFDFLEGAGEQVQDLFGDDRSFGALAFLLFWIFALIGIARWLESVREALPDRGLIPSLCALAQLAARLLSLGLGVAFVMRLLPDEASLASLLFLAAAAVALGWSARDVLPDLVAGLVLNFERRLARGNYVELDSVRGTVERMGLRTTQIVDAQGHIVAVPNRLLLDRALRSRGKRQEHEVHLSIPNEVAALAQRALGEQSLRAALRDASLATPWTHPSASVEVGREPAHPDRWWVRTRLLSPRFAAAFESELLERTERTLRVATADPNPVASEGLDSEIDER